MESYVKYCLNIVWAWMVLSCISCDRLSNEHYNHLNIDERRALSADYTQLAKRLEMGSPKHMKLLEKAIRINPSNDLAWRELSTPYLYAGLYKEWNEYMEMAVELNPEAWQAWRGYDRLFYFREYAGALFDLDASDSLTRDQIDYPQNISVDYLRGLCYYGLKDNNRSIEFFLKHISDEEERVGPEYVDEAVFVYLGLLYEREGDFKKAIECFDRGLKYEDSFADFHFHKARLYCYTDNVELSMQQFETAKAKFEEGNCIKSYRYEAFEQLYTSDFDQLEEQLIEAVSIDSPITLIAGQTLEE